MVWYIFLCCLNSAFECVQPPWKTKILSTSRLEFHELRILYRLLEHTSMIGIHERAPKIKQKKIGAVLHFLQYQNMNESFSIKSRFHAFFIARCFCSRFQNSSFEFLNKNMYIRNYACGCWGDLSWLLTVLA